MLLRKLSMQVLSELVSEVRQALPTRVSDLPDEELKLLIESCLARLDLVPRTEFDAQKAVLERTRQRVQQLEQQLTDLEQQLQQPE